MRVFSINLLGSYLPKYLHPVHDMKIDNHTGSSVRKSLHLVKCHVPRYNFMREKG